MEKKPEPLPSADFLGLRLADCSASALAEWIVAMAAARAKATLGYVNAATFNLACESPEIASLLAGMDALYADGKSVVWASRWLGQAVPERISAADFMDLFVARCAERGLRIALIGGAPGEARGAAERLAQKSPSAEFVLCRDGFFDASESGNVLAEIDRADPRIVLLGMGSPLQERLAAEWSRKSGPRVWWCVGALFEYFSGLRPRAPEWMRRAGLEWAFRLALEPRRLWRRYLLGNPKFVWRVLARRGPQFPPSQ